MDARLNWVKCHAFGKIVDIGCNEGMAFRDAPFASQVTGVDIDNWNPKNYGRFVQSDASSLPFTDKEFDCAVCSEILEHVPDPVKVLKEAIRVAKCIVFSVPNEYNWSENLEPFQSGERRRVKMEEGIQYTLSHRYCRGMVDDKTHPHLFHQRQFTRDTLASSFVDSGLKYRIDTLDFDEVTSFPTAHWSFFLGTAIPTADKWDDIFPRIPITTDNLAGRIQEAFSCGEKVLLDLTNKCLVYDWSVASREFRKIIRFVVNNHIRVSVSIGDEVVELMSLESWTKMFSPQSTEKN